MPRTHSKKRIAAAAAAAVGVTALLAPLAQTTAAATAAEPAYSGAYVRALSGGDVGGQVLDGSFDPTTWPVARPANSQETYEITEKGIGDDGKPLTVGEEWETYAINLDTATGEAATAIHQRSDVCAVPAAGVVAEAMVAFVLADAVLEKFGGDSVAETRRNLESYLAAIPDALRTEVASAQPTADRV